MARKKRLLFAAVDTGYRIEHYTNFIHQHFSDKLIAESFSKFVLDPSHYKSSYTYTCPVDKIHPLRKYSYCAWFFIFSLFRYDIFHFIAGETILTRKLRRFELFIYKLLGKRVVMQFVGSDIRSEQFIYWKDKNIRAFLEGNVQFERNLPWQKKLIRDAEKYADAILVSTPDMKPFVKNAIYYPALIDLEKFMREAQPGIPTFHGQDEEIVILHAPSNTAIKGTSHIHEVLKKLQQKSPYKIKLLLPGESIMGTAKKYAVTRYDLFKLFKEADIIIDQVIIGWYGLQSIEALLMGKEVISYVEKDLESDLFPNCPIKLASINTLEEAVLTCIEKIRSGKVTNYQDTLNWVKKYYTLENNNKPLLAAWGLSKE